MNEVAPSATSLIPVNDCVLVELDRTEKRESKYDTRTSGICVKVPEDVLGYATEDIREGELGTVMLSNDKPQPKYLVGKRVYFEEYKEGARIKRDGKLYCFIKLEDVRGYEDV